MSIKPWTLAAIVVTATTIGLFSNAIVLVFAMTRVHLAILGVLGILLPNLIFLGLVASIILWIVAGVRRLVQR